MLVAADIQADARICERRASCRRGHTCLYGGEEAGGVLHQVGEDEFEPQVVELCQDVKSLGATCRVEAAVHHCAVRWCAITTLG